jgi:hypothetical protein
MEKQHTINGVQGRYWMIKNPGVRAPHCHDAQKWVSEARPVKGYGEPAFLRVEIRHDDECKNGHNSFAITGDIRGARGRDIAGGCLHEDIARVFPELAHLIKWHLCSTDGPMHYVANTLYWLGYQGYCGEGDRNPPNIEHARSTAVWPDMPESFICPEELREVKAGEIFGPLKKEKIEAVQWQLGHRLPGMLEAFKSDLEAAGFAFAFNAAEVAL